MEEEETAWAAATDKNRSAATAPSERAEAGEEKVHGASRVAPIPSPLLCRSCVVLQAPVPPVPGPSRFIITLPRPTLIPALVTHSTNTKKQTVRNGAHPMAAALRRTT